METSHCQKGYQRMYTVTIGYEQESASEEAKDASAGPSSPSSTIVIIAQIAEEKMVSSVSVVSSFQSPSLEADFAISSAAFAEVLWVKFQL